jgi:hypothetical protein
MEPDLNAGECCAVCGKDANLAGWFCHFYQEQNRVTLCSPACAEFYLHHPHGGGNDRTSASESWFTSEVEQIAS